MMGFTFPKPSSPASLAKLCSSFSCLFPGTENNSVWELIHTKSETEGRPETVFQLCCRYTHFKNGSKGELRALKEGGYF